MDESPRPSLAAAKVAWTMSEVHRAEMLSALLGAKCVESSSWNMTTYSLVSRGLASCGTSVSELPFSCLQ